MNSTANAEPQRAGIDESVAPRIENTGAPLYIAWEVSLRCNARCIHCYSSSGPGVRHPLELNTTEALSVIDQLADAGLLILAFSGGEPLLRRDIFELINHAVERGLIVNVATNGAIITDALAIRLREAGVRSITVSLDGAAASTHNTFRQFLGSSSERSMQSASWSAKITAWL